MIYIRIFGTIHSILYPSLFHASSSIFILCPTFHSFIAHTIHMSPTSFIPNIDPVIIMVCGSISSSHHCVHHSIVLHYLRRTCIIISFAAACVVSDILSFPSTSVQALIALLPDAFIHLSYTIHHNHRNSNLQSSTAHSVIVSFH